MMVISSFIHFMFEKVRFWPPNECAFYIMSVYPFIFDRLINIQVPKVNKMIPISIGGHTKYRITLTVDLHHGSLEFIVMFNSNEPHLININNISRQ